MADTQSQRMLSAVEQLLNSGVNSEGHRHTVLDVPEGRCVVFIGVSGAHVSYPGIMMLGELNDGTKIVDMHFNQADGRLCATRSWRVVDDDVESLMVNRDVPEPHVIPGLTDSSHESAVLLGMNIERMAEAPNRCDPVFLVQHEYHLPAQFIDKDTTYMLMAPPLLLALLRLGSGSQDSEHDPAVDSWLGHGYHPLTIAYAKQLQAMVK